MMDWLEVAKALPLGQKKRVHHECGEDRPLVIGHDEIGYSAYCHRCGPIGNQKHGYMNLAEIQRLNDLNKNAKEQQSNELPRDFTLHIPRGKSSWLLKAGITAHRAAALGIGWSPRLNRIVLPLYGKDGTLLYWQARAVDKGQSPKYINPSVPKDALLYTVSPDNAADTGEEVVVTEDILSAIRVGKHCPAVSILGTKTSDHQASAICRYVRVTYWLDPDDAGRRGAIAGIRKLGLVTTARTVESPVDPKNLSDREIREYLGLEPNHRYDYHGNL